MGSSLPSIRDEVVEFWLNGIILSVNRYKTADTPINIFSLLGQKPNGLSEFSYYSFRGGFDTVESRPHVPSWQEWLNTRYGATFHLEEFPTIDTTVILDPMRLAIVNAIISAIQSNVVVVLVDSGGVGRTGYILKCIRNKYAR